MSGEKINGVIVGRDDMPDFKVHELLKNNIDICRINLQNTLANIDEQLKDVNGDCDVPSLLEEKKEITNALARFDRFKKHLEKIERYGVDIRLTNVKDVILEICERIKEEQALLRIMFYGGYDEVFPLDSGYRKVEKDDKAGVVTSDGKVTIPIEYNKESFPEMKNKNLPYVEKGLRGIMNICGDVVHAAEYTEPPMLLDNGYAVALNSTNPLYKSKCLLNDKGELLISGFSGISLSQDSHGLLTVKQGKEYGKCNLDGTEVIPCVYCREPEDSGIEGVYIARRDRGDCLIKNDGTVIFDSNEYFGNRKGFKKELYNIGKFSEDREGEPRVATISISRRINESYGNYGRYAINASYGLINRKYGLIDENGKVLIYPKYATELQHYDGDLYLTTKEVGTLLGKLLGKNKTMNIYVSCEDGKEYVDNKKLI